MREMKDSGIKLIGEIPKDWVIRRGKTLYTIQTGKLDANTAKQEGNYPFLHVQCSQKKLIIMLLIAKHYWLQETV